MEKDGNRFWPWQIALSYYFPWLFLQIICFRKLCFFKKNAGSELVTSSMFRFNCFCSYICFFFIFCVYRDFALFFWIPLEVKDYVSRQWLCPSVWYNGYPAERLSLLRALANVVRLISSNFDVLPKTSCWWLVGWLVHFPPNHGLQRLRMQIKRLI